ncbi:lipoprotein [Thermomonas sp.]|uniref:LPS translocon maturation chaperone LptM n=1 Tax=Thermomonas sp. TaxID=1971895 RepID=UPI002488C461|nr:lipoprotein [Thermomonas sp.]MDI1254013.1 lipoprotein [Thermomonas sp.]
MNVPIKNIALLIALSIACVALTGCGNKGPLVKPSNIPATMPAAKPAVAPAAAVPASDSVVTPVPEPASGTPAARR